MISEIQRALNLLRSEHVLGNSHKLGLLGQQDLTEGITVLENLIRDTENPGQIPLPSGEPEPLLDRAELTHSDPRVCVCTHGYVCPRCREKGQL